MTRVVIRHVRMIAMPSQLKWYYNRIKSYIGRPRLIVQQMPVVLDDADRCESPIFILGVQRSGTSLVRRMFNSHPQIACPPESFFLAHYVAMFDDREVLAGYDGFGFDKEAMRADIARHASSLHEAYRVAQGKRIWADKTPDYTAIIDGLDRLFARKSRFVLVLRHPGDSIYSMIRRGWLFNDIADPFESALAHYRAGIDRMLAFERAHPERCARIVYHALCAEPERVLRAALEKLGLQYDAQMLRFGDKAHNFGLEDPVIRGKKEIDISEGTWRTFGPAKARRLAEVFGPEIERDDFWLAAKLAPPDRVRHAQVA